MSLLPFLDIGKGIADAAGDEISAQARATLYKSQAAADLFNATGADLSAAAYGKASDIATANQAITLRSGQIQEQMQGIQTFKVMGAEQAGTAGAGFDVTSGSAGDLLRSSAQQAALSKQLIGNQTQITAQGYEQEAVAYKGQQGAVTQEALALRASAAGNKSAATDTLNAGHAAAAGSILGGIAHAFSFGLF